MRIEHDIFHTPYEVALTIEERETPASYSSYLGGARLGDMMPMWRVQTEGYKDGTDQLIGVVAGDLGFLDSPDTEWISSGANSKGPRAVALGRQASFFHWGFAASPTYMTEEAKLVFVNALHYIARFDGHRPVCSKHGGMVVREQLDRVLQGITEQGYARVLADYQGLRESVESKRAEVQARVDAGETISEMDRLALNRPEPQDPDRFAGLRRLFPSDELEAFGEDPDRIASYLRENRGYLHPGANRYTLEIDQELREFGFANDDPKWLQAAIRALSGDSAKDAESPDEHALAHAASARRLLERYTTETFASAAEWSAWLQTNRDRLFFTEVGGYKWLVDTQTRTPAPAQVVPRKPRPEPTIDRPLVFEWKLVPGENKRYSLSLSIEIFEGWHAYESVPPDEAYAPLIVTLDLPEGLKREGDWQRPFAIPDFDRPELSLYEGKLEFRCTLVDEGLSDPAKIGCKLSYQVCDAVRCQPPRTEVHTIEVLPGF